MGCGPRQRTEVLEGAACISKIMACWLAPSITALASSCPHCPNAKAHSKPAFPHCELLPR